MTVATTANVCCREPYMLLGKRMIASPAQIVDLVSRCFYYAYIVHVAILEVSIPTNGAAETFPRDAETAARS